MRTLTGQVGTRAVQIPTELMSYVDSSGYADAGGRGSRVLLWMPQLYGSSRPSKRQVRTRSVRSRTGPKRPLRRSRRQRQSCTQHAAIAEGATTRVLRCKCQTRAGRTATSCRRECQSAGRQSGFPGTTGTVPSLSLRCQYTHTGGSPGQPRSQPRRQASPEGPSSANRRDPVT